MITQKCTICNENKILEKFSFRKSRKKYINQCFDCCKLRDKNYYEIHKETAALDNKKYSLENDKNQGKYDPKTWNDNDPATWKWQLDHIVPHSTFKYENMDCEEFRTCWSLSNLRPLSAKQNFWMVYTE